MAVKSRHLWYANVHIFYLTSNKFAQIKTKCVEKHNIYKKKKAGVILHRPFYKGHTKGCDETPIDRI